MANCGNDRNRRIGYCLNDDFLGEGKKIFQRASPPADDKDVHQLAGVSDGNLTGDLFRRIRPLYGSR